MTENDLLGKDANIVASFQNVDYFRQWRLLAHAQKLLIEANVKTSRTNNPHRTRLCHAVRAFNADSIAVKIPSSSHELKATLSGVQTCGSVWSCPVCAKKIAIERGHEIKHTIQEMKKLGFVPIMITLTASHTYTMRLADFKGLFKSAWRKMSQDGTYNRLKKELKIKHSIKANEVTYGDRNGWHYHSHGLLFIPIDTLKRLSDGELKEWTDKLTDVWLRCLKDNDLSGSRERALNIKAHGEIEETYIAKLGLSDDTSNLNYELTSGANKYYKGLNIWEILRRATNGRDRYARLYVEYVEAMTGDNWITYSHGLKKLVGIIDKEDKDISEDESETSYYETLVELNDMQYAVIRKYRAYHDLLKIAAELRSAEAVMNFVNGLHDLDIGRDFQAKIIRMEKQLAYLVSQKWEFAKQARMNPSSKMFKEQLEHHMRKIETLSDKLEHYKLGDMPFRTYHGERLRLS